MSKPLAGPATPDPRLGQTAQAYNARLAAGAVPGPRPTGPSPWSPVRFGGPGPDADPRPGPHLAGLAEAAADPALAARSPSEIPQAGDLVDVATGDVLLVQRDVSRPGALPLVMGRVYRSSWRAGRWFGPSWASALDQRLQVTPKRAACVFADGRVLYWLCTADADGPRPVTGLPVTGPRWRLERAAGGGFTVTDPAAGLVWRFERRPGFHQGPDGAGELPLVAVTDRAGHRIGYEYTPSGQPAFLTHSGGYRVRMATARRPDEWPAWLSAGPAGVLSHRPRWPS